MTGRIVVGVDASPASGRALRWAIVEAALRRSQVVAVAAWQVPDASFNVYRPASYDALRRDVEREVRELAVASVDAACALEPTTDGVRTIVHAVEGSPADALVAESIDADLLVVGARGLNAVQRFVLGSTSRDVLARAHCPTVVVHAAPDERNVIEEAELRAEIAAL